MHAETFVVAVTNLAAQADEAAAQNPLWERISEWLITVAYAIDCEMVHSAGEILQNFTLP